MYVHYNTTIHMYILNANEVKTEVFKERIHIEYVKYTLADTTW